VTAWAFSLVFPFLLTLVLLQGIATVGGRSPRGLVPALGLTLVAAGLVLIPVTGLPIGRWLVSLHANASIPLTAILLSRVVRVFLGVRLVDDKALLTCWIFSLAAGAFLYPMALGLGRWDPYGAGWGFSWLFVLLLGVTLVLLAMKNRFAVVLMGVMAAYNLGLLESTNLWDYLVDPVLVIVSLIGLGWRIGAKREGIRRKALGARH
jgi:hypothetical protein